jgi:predicted dienelactone hydrolase
MHIFSRRTASGLFAFALAAFTLPSTASAQQHVSAPRADGQSTPLLVYAALHPAADCPPLAVISHGAGGSEDGYRYLAQAMAGMGYTTVVMGHRESGLTALMADIRADGIRAGIRALVVDSKAEQARLLDVGAALAWASTQCKSPFRVLLGHSMGSETVMLEAGAKNILGIASPPAGRNRFDAYVALSPEGPGIVFADHAWGRVRRPILILTGTRDESLKGGPEARQIPWHDLPGRHDNCQWMGVIDGATHMNFAGSGLGHERVEPLVTSTIAAFLQGVRAGRCTLPPPIASMPLQAK